MPLYQSLWLVETIIFIQSNALSHIAFARARLWLHSNLLFGSRWKHTSHQGDKLYHVASHTAGQGNTPTGVLTNFHEVFPEQNVLWQIIQEICDFLKSN